MTYVHSLDACKYKSLSTLDIASSSFTLLIWVLDSACTFSFTINRLINYPLQCSAHVRSFWNSKQLYKVI